MRTKTYSKNEIQKAIDLHRGGASKSEIARTLGCGYSSVNRWIQGTSQHANAAPTEKQQEPINNLLLNMARGNDLSKWSGRPITSLSPREIYDFLKAINVKGELKVTQTISI